MSPRGSCPKSREAVKYTAREAVMDPVTQQKVLQALRKTYEEMMTFPITADTGVIEIETWLWGLDSVFKTAEDSNIRLAELTYPMQVGSRGAGS